MKTEEDLKVQVLLPFLDAIGIPPEAVSAERSFRLTLGTNTYTKHGESIETASGRSDLLISNADGEPLFIVETKKPGDALTEEDVDQGISYARLLKKMAPFVIVTNGATTRLFDTISREEMKTEALSGRLLDWRSGKAMRGVDDLAIRAQALESFVGYSAEHLSAFSQLQVDERCRALLDGTIAPARVIPNVYVARKLFQESLQPFLASKASAFVLDAPSGLGKTNELCETARALVGTHFVLFFRAADLYDSLQSCIASEFGWVFSEQIPLVQVLRRVEQFASRHGQKAVFVFDGIDEYSSSNAPEQFNELAKRINEFGGTLRLIVSVKTVEWPRFAASRGVASALATNAWIAPSPTMRPDVEGPRTSCSLGLFTDDESRDAFEKYRKVFRFRGDPYPRLLDQLKDPFLLRIVSEVCAERDLVYDLGQPELLLRYIDRRLATLPEKERALAEEAVVAVATRMAVLGTSFSIPASEAGVGLARAVECGLLVVSTDTRGRRTVDICFDRVRDYLIVFRVHKLDHLAADRLASAANLLSHSPIGRQALLLYLYTLPPASERHAIALFGIVQQAAEAVMQTYNLLRAQVANSVQRAMLPRLPPGSVRLVYSVEPYGRWSRGLASLDQKDASLGARFVAGLWSQCEEASLGPGGPIAVKQESIWRAVEDPALFAAEWFLEQLRSVVKEGGLDETGSLPLLREVACAVIARHREKLGLPRSAIWNAYASWLGADIDPVSIEGVRRTVHALFAQHAAEWEPETRRLPPAEASKRINESRQRAMKGERFPRPNRSPADPLGVLDDALDALHRHGIAFVSHYLPAPDIPEDVSDQGLLAGYSDDRLKQLVMTIRTTVANEWQPFLQRNFGRLGAVPPLIAAQPGAEIIHYRRPRTADRLDDGTFCRARLSGDFRLFVHVGEDDPFVWDGEGQERRLTATVDGVQVQLAGPSICGPEHMIGSRSEFPIGWHGPQGYLTPARTLIYEEVSRALEAANPSQMLEALGT